MYYYIIISENLPVFNFLFNFSEHVEMPSVEGETQTNLSEGSDISDDEPTTPQSQVNDPDFEPSKKKKKKQSTNYGRKSKNAKKKEKQR